MKDPEDTTRRTIEMPEHEITTHVEYNLVAGEYQVVLNPDADMLPSRVKLYLPAVTARELIRDLAEQQAEADKRNDVEDNPVEWAGRTFGQLTADEKARATRQAAVQLQAELQAAAPAIARVLAGESEPAEAQDDTRWEDPRDTEHGSTEQVRRIPVSQTGSGCPVCGSDLWGFDTTDDETRGLGVASCDRGHEWIVTEG